MTKRYFYTDALAAEWMCKYHGMKFTDEMENEVVPFYHRRLDRFYLHTDSVALLQPLDCDIITFDVKTNDGQTFKQHGWFGYNKNENNIKIIHRDGAVFMWPEDESIN